MIQHEVMASTKIVPAIKEVVAIARAANDTVVFQFNFWDITVHPTDSVAEIVGQFHLSLYEGEDDHSNVKLHVLGAGK